jgi:hypothetical protein
MTEHSDPYAVQGPAFPTQDLFEVRPTGSTIRRGRGWIFVGVVVAAIVGIIAMDWVSKSKPVKASQPVTAYGLGTIPLKDAKPEERAAEIKKEERKEEEKKAPQKVVKAAPRRHSALGGSDQFENPSQRYAEREVTSWNPESGSRKSKESIANHRKSALNRVYFENRSFSSSGFSWSLTQSRSATA